MLYFVNGDILEGNYDIFCHQVNCLATMGAGLALQIQKKYPNVAAEYYKKCFSAYDQDTNLLGQVLYVKTKDNNWCVNMFAQEKYGKDKCYTDYTAFDSCLEHISKKLSISSPALKIAFPDHIGCGLAGGDWAIIKPKLVKFANSVKQDVYIVKKT